MSNKFSSSVKWTDEQKLAIELSGGNVLVTAAAGSGKTAVLTERLMRRITAESAPADIRRFVIVTFTKAAAAEMKSRLTAKLNSYIKTHPNSAHAKRQVMYVTDANISTIDSFCLSLIEKYQSIAKSDLGYTPGMRILSEREEELLLEKAITEAIEAECEKGDESFNKLADALDSGESSGSAGVKHAVAAVYAMLRLSPDPEGLRSEILSEYGEAYSDTRRSIWFGDVFEKIALAAEYYKDRAADILSEAPCYYTGNETVGRFVEAMEVLKKDAITLKEAAEGHDYETCRTLFHCGVTEVKTRRDRGVEYEWCTLAHNLKDEFKKFYEAQLPDFVNSEEDLRKEGRLILPLLDKLFEITKSVDKIYAALKNDRNSWDFSDVELKAIELLWEKDADGSLRRSEISLRESDEYDEILIDEYQDVNALQELIFKGIASENEDNLFMVGDVKQSVYGFRGAVPELFLKRRDEYCLATPEDSEFPAKVALNANFRSREGVTSAVNAVFNAIMRKETCSMDYLDEDNLKPKSEYEANDQSGTYLTLLDKTIDEADYVTSRIAQLIRDGVSVKDVKTGNYRPVKYGDIAIMLRSTKSDSAKFVEALTKAGIPVSDPMQDGFFKSPSVKKVISALSAIDNPMKDINLVAAMSGGMFGFSESELISIRQKSDGAFYYAVKAAAEDGDEKAADFLKKLEHLRRKSALLTAEEFVWYVYKTTGYLSFVKTLKNGKKEHESLILLKEHAKAFGASGRQDLSGYVSYLGSITSKDAKGSGKGEGRDDEVKIITIHKSKGLEFPICFLCRAEKRFSTDDAKKAFLADPGIGVGMKLSLPDKNMTVNTFGRRSVLRRLLEKQKCEEMRLLYVAMTRARERLEIVATVKSPIESAENSSYMLDAAGYMDSYCVKKANSFLDWLLPVAMGTSVFRVNLSPRCEKEEKNLSLYEVKEHDLDLSKRIYDNVTSQYAYLSSTVVPSKMTVTDIVSLMSKDEKAEYCCERRPACMNSEGNNAAEAGTALHAFLQFANYENLGDAEGEIERLISERFITERQAELINRRKLTSFVSSDLFRRISSAQKVIKELRFTFEAKASEFLEGAPDDNFLIQGAIDCVFEENGKTIIVDYKTDRISGNLDAKVRYYSPQLKMYARGLKELTGKEAAEGILYFLDADESVRVW